VPITGVVKTDNKKAGKNFHPRNLFIKPIKIQKKIYAAIKVCGLGCYLIGLKF
jgi:hypothetical protein